MHNDNALRNHLDGIVLNVSNYPNLSLCVCVCVWLDYIRSINERIELVTWRLFNRDRTYLKEHQISVGLFRVKEAESSINKNL